MMITLKKLNTFQSVFIEFFIEHITKNINLFANCELVLKCTMRTLDHNNLFKYTALF